MKNDLYKIITFGWFVLLSPSAFCLCNTSIPPVTGEPRDSAPSAVRTFVARGSAPGNNSFERPHNNNNNNNHRINNNNHNNHNNNNNHHHHHHHHHHHYHNHNHNDHNDHNDHNKEPPPQP